MYKEIENAYPSFNNFCNCSLSALATSCSTYLQIVCNIETINILCQNNTLQNSLLSQMEMEQTISSNYTCHWPLHI